ncbi:2-octaprenyl-6-methoxyphenyl hydroxylase [Neptunicella marina]|uniref:2-octaprenyl-6-methoxyphenyl hydroxylase n=1 Tax=Neptunicella marina TaxID=2125989 RepID=A0A8J6ISY4_9ALTE|nr:2-octaprenyl-6-methoxyphenyl hydroxylase [Neptunicella marina]MBC3766855.1 2-octaprenyl-6-methoxyphenyl hydroxylase [Neptunicella marina]
MTSEFDVVIAGGGTVGLTLALALCQQTELSVAIVEAKIYQADQLHPGFDARSIALAKHTQEVLTGLGLDIADLGTAIQKIKVTDKGFAGQCWLDAKEQQLDALGFVVDLHPLGEQLHQLLQQQSPQQLHWFCPDSIESLTQYADKVEISLQSGAAISAGLLVVADGAKSTTASLLKADYQSDDYHQSAIIANVEMSQPHRHIAYERFTQKGPLALLPRAGNTCSLVWTVARDQQQAMLDMPDAQFLTELQQAFGYDLGLFKAVSQRYAYPLSLTRACEQPLHRAVLIGNASHTLHPIAGQGFNLGLRDVEVLAYLLAQACSNKQDCGEFSLLHRYHQARKPDHQRVIGLTDSLVRIFSNHDFPLVMSRNIGLSLLNAFPSLKSALADQAMGFLSPSISMKRQ